VALKKQTSHKGIAADYWRINNFQYDDKTDKASIHLWLYKDKTTSDENLDNGLRREVIGLNDVSKIAIPEELQSETNPRNLLKTMLYQKLKESKLEDGKETNWFADAEDA